MIKKEVNNKKRTRITLRQFIRHQLRVTQKPFNDE